MGAYGATASRFAAKVFHAISFAALSGYASPMSFNPSTITASLAAKKVDLEEIAVLESVWSAVHLNGCLSIQKKNLMLGKKRMIQAYDFLYSYYVEYD